MKVDHVTELLNLIKKVVFGRTFGKVSSCLEAKGWTYGSMRRLCLSTSVRRVYVRSWSWTHAWTCSVYFIQSPWNCKLVFLAADAVRMLRHMIVWIRQSPEYSYNVGVCSALVFSLADSSTMRTMVIPTHLAKLCCYWQHQRRRVLVGYGWPT